MELGLGSGISKSCLFLHSLDRDLDNQCSGCELYYKFIEVSVDGGCGVLRTKCREIQELVRSGAPPSSEGLGFRVLRFRVLGF